MDDSSRVYTPTSLVLLGATGDLSQKKLLPALMKLLTKKVLPFNFHIVAFSRKQLTTEEYRTLVRQSLEARGDPYDEKDLARFLDLFEFVSGDFSKPEGFHAIKKALNAYDDRIGMCTSKLFYLATPPSTFERIFEQIEAADLGAACSTGPGWTRILVEKPFGTDLAHAERLEKKLSTIFEDKQIYRIDHYLAKDAVQNILAFRFSNSLFEQNWNKDYIEGVYIKLFESFGVRDRGAFFDTVGALRDMGQNHMLQMLALIAMGHPDELVAPLIREKRREVIAALIPPTKAELGERCVKGRYEGYRSVRNVDPNSQTETYFALKTYLALPDFEGVPIYLEHGKALSKDRIEIGVRFRSSKTCVCGEKAPHDHPTIVRFMIQPEQKITIRFWVRKPGLRYELEPNDLVFDRDAVDAQNGITHQPDAYEEVLHDAIRGEQTLFVSSKEQEAAWSFIGAIVDAWKDIPLVSYEPGSEGPSSKIKEEIFTRMHLFT